MQRHDYETPSVTTIDARELLEALGPVCCYSGNTTPVQPKGMPGFGPTPNRS